VVDTTAAGDTFLGAVATALGAGTSLDEAVSLGVRAAALCVTRPGAQPAIPTREEVLQSPPTPAWTAL
jgi:ribokinase